MKPRFQLLCLFCLILLGILAVLTQLFWQILLGSEQRFRRTAIALDRAGNVALNGIWWQTISGRAGRKWPWGAKAINWLFQDPSHCRLATYSDKETLSNAQRTIE
jgi:hypothetical protein